MADPEPGASTRNMLAAIRGEAKVACSFADAFTSVEVIDKAFASARDGERWMALDA